MNISYRLIGKKAVKKLYVRVYYNKLDLTAFTNLLLTENQWNEAEQIIVNYIELNIALQDLKSDILKQFNKDLVLGIVFDNNWLKNVVKLSFSRPKEERNLSNPAHTIYLSDFSTWWLDNHSQKWEVSHKKLMDEPLRKQYRKFLEILSEYEAEISEKLQLRTVTIADIKSFVDYLEVEKYALSTIERHVSRFRFFLNRAVEANFEIDKSYKKRIYLGVEEDEIEDIYWNENEIQDIYDLDLSEDDELDNIRDNAIIAAWTALRVSDFMFNLKTDNIKDGIISVKTKKTGSFVKIPVHWMVKAILDKRFGQLPKKTTASIYNKKIKTICMLAGMDSIVFGKLFDKDLKRKKTGYFKKWELCSSHIGRKSLASNLNGKVSKETMNSVFGWSKNSNMANHYDKTSKLEHAEKVRDQWNKK